MKSRRAIFLVLVASIISAIVQLLLKRASQKLDFSIQGILTPELIIGFLLFAVVAFLFIIALKEGELTVLYPLLALTYVWVAIASPIFFESDSLSVTKVIGIGIIIFGIYAIGKGMEHRVEAIQ